MPSKNRNDDFKSKAAMPPNKYLFSAGSDGILLLQTYKSSTRLYLPFGISPACVRRAKVL